MRFLRDLLDKVEPHFDRGGKLEFFYPLFESADTLFYTPGKVNRGTVQVRDNIDSCGGFIGEDELNEHLNNEATWGLPRDAIEIVGDAEYAVELKAPESV